MKESKSLARQMGLLIAAALAWGTHVRRGHVGLAIWTCSAGLAALALIRPQVFTPIAAVWMKLARALEAVVSPLAMAVIYTLLFVPTGLIRRLRGVDTLNMKPDKTAETYWKATPQEEVDFNTMY